MLTIGKPGITGTGLTTVGLGVSVGGGPSGPTPWVTVWQTTEPGETITLPFVSAGTYDVHVDWGDGSTDNITAYDDPAVTHAFATPGTQTIAITGVMTHWSFRDRADSKDQIIAVTEAGTTGETLTHLDGGFRFCLNLTSVPNGAWTRNLSPDFGARELFRNARSFNSDISAWDVSHVTNLHRIFSDAQEFNQDIGGWDVSSVMNMSGVFESATAFNQDISGWDVSSATTMALMFSGAAAFNQDISGWDVSSVTNMDRMFQNAAAFDQDIGGWDVSSVVNMDRMFQNVTLSTANYDALLIGWSQRTLQNNVQFHGGNSQYSAAAAAARQHIIDTYNWTITDGGLAA